MTPRSCLRWKPTGRVFKNVVLRWVPTGKTFASSTTKVDSEPPNGSNADITNQCESEQALDVSACTLLSTEHPSDTNVFTMKMEILLEPASNKLLVGLESVSIRRIQCVGYGVLGFLGVGTTFDIFQNIHILYLQYGVLIFSRYDVLIIDPSWSLVSVGTDTPYLP
ncbi:hypothetical protein Tco_0323692 [Tanacetum coccineum]